MKTVHTGVDPVADAEATLRATLGHQLYQWRQYLWARSVELAETTADAAAIEPPAGIGAADGTPLAAADLLLGSLTAGTRACFDRSLESRRQTAQAAATPVREANDQQADPNDVLRRLLAQLRLAAHGDAAIEVPYADTTYLLAADAALPPSDDGLPPATAGRRRLALLLGLLLVFGVGLLLVGRDFAQARGKAPAEPLAAVMVGATPLTLPIPQHLYLTPSAGAGLDWPLAPLTAGDEPLALPAGTAAAWLTDAAAPAVVCLGSAATQAVVSTGGSPELTLEDADGTQRFFRTAEITATTADLLLLACDGSAVPTVLLAARFAEEQQVVPLAVGATAELADGVTVALDTLAVQSADGGEGFVLDLAVFATGPADLLALEPTLLLRDGTALPPSEQLRAEGDAELVTLRYLLPASEGGAAAVWQLSATDGRVARWALDVPAAPTRAALLATADVTIEEAWWQADYPPTLRLQLRLHNGGDTALLLLPEDLTMTQEGEPLLILGGLPQQPIGSDATIALTIAAQPLHERPVLLTLGAHRWAIDPATK